MSTTDTKPAGNPAVWSTFRESPLAVKTILVGILVSRLSGFLNIFLVLFLASKGHSIQAATLALGAFGAGSVVGVLVGGTLTDRLGARRATVFSMSSAAVLTATLLYLPNYGLILVVAALVGTVGQVYRPASATLLSELTSTTNQVMIFAMYRFGMNLGAMAAPLVGYGLYNLSHQQYTLVFWGEALIALAYAGLAQATLPARTQQPATSTDATGGPASGGSYLDVLRDRRYTIYLISAFINAAVYVQYLSTLPLDIERSGLPILWYTVAVSLNGFIVICVELPVTKVSQNWPFRVTIGLAMALVGAGMAFYGLPIGPAVIIIGTLIWTLAEIVGAPAAFAYPAVVAPAHLKSRYIGSFQFMFGLGTAAGPLIGGALLAQLGHGVWPVVALGSMVALVLVLLGVQNQPKVKLTTVEQPLREATASDEPSQAAVATEPT